jgi:dUTP diphosphatase
MDCPEAGYAVGGCVYAFWWSLTVLNYAHLKFFRPKPGEQMQITFKRLDLELPIPAYAHIGDAAVDLHTRFEISLRPGERVAADTGLAVSIPTGWAGLVLPRSGHARKLGVGVVNSPGLIDSGYRGEISVILINHGDEPVSFDRGDRIAQLAIVPVAGAEWMEVDDLDRSERGDGGFGSTGV